MSKPPSAYEPTAGPSHSSSQNEAETSDLLDADLVEEIKKYPVLYRQAQEEYEMRIEKKKVWAAISRTLFKNWTSYSQQNKLSTIKEIQRRWIKLKDEFFKRKAEGRLTSPDPKKRKTIFDSMAFLLQSTGAQDPDMFLSFRESGQQLVGGHNEMPPILTHCDTLTQGPPEGVINTGIQTYIPPTGGFNLDIPSTSSAPQHEVIPDDPNVHFSLMLVPLLNRLNHEELYATWSAILKLIKEAEDRSSSKPLKLQILQKELSYPPGVIPEPEPIPDTAEESIEEEPVYPSRHGRPTNPDGDIMYPTTDNEDED